MALKGQEKKGFTLVEVIVVLVILAILMAIAIPSLTGYIDKANERAILTEASNIQSALQVASTDVYGQTGTTISGFGDYQKTGGLGVAASWDDIVNDLAKTDLDGSQLSNVTFSGSELIGFKFRASGGKTVIYNATATPKFSIT